MSNMNKPNKILSGSLNWIRKSVNELESMASGGSEANIFRKEGRSQSMVTSRPHPKLWRNQHSVDCGTGFSPDEDPFHVEEEEVSLDGTSKIMTEDDVAFLNQQLPKRLTGSVWKLQFSTESHGFSLSTVYRVAKDRDPDCKAPCLFLLRNTDNQRIGAYLSECPQAIDKCYGSGETFVFQLKEEGKNACFKWCGDSSYNLFISGSNDCFGVGIDDGKFAIYIDSSLNQGRSQPCRVFQSPVLTLKEDFVATDVELWTFR